MSGVRLSGRVLYLTEDAELLSAQLAGETLSFDAARPLLANISTDELTPAWACYYYDQTLARYCLRSARGVRVQLREDLPAELPEHWAPDEHGLLAARALGAR